jgi:hypothetical protein
MNENNKVLHNSGTIEMEQGSIPTSSQKMLYEGGDVPA